MPYTEKQLKFFRVAMNDKKRTPSERAEFRRMYNEGKSMPRKRPVRKKAKHGRKS